MKIEDVIKANNLVTRRSELLGLIRSRTKELEDQKTGILNLNIWLSSVESTLHAMGVTSKEDEYAK